MQLADDGENFQPPWWQRYPRDWQLWLVLALALLIVLPRSLLVARAHSECYDDQPQLAIGVCFLSGRMDQAPKINDPPLGHGLLALPLWLAGCRPAADGSVLYGQTLSSETLLMGVAGWKSLLFLPLVAVVFIWARRLWGTGAAWVSAGLLVFEPNFAAHVPIAAIDSLAATATAIAVFLAWRYFERPTLTRLIVGTVALAVALNIKHNAAVAAFAVVGFAILWWVIKPSRDGESWPTWRLRLRPILTATLISLVVFFVAMWALTGFDISQPIRPTQAIFDPQSWSARRWIGGTYLRSFVLGYNHNLRGHPAYFFGETRMLGWWYYYPLLATYKVPLGILAMLALAAISYIRRPMRFAEWGVLLPLAIGSAFIMTANINIGFRHFLPVYAFLIPLSGRAVVAGRAGAARRMTGCSPRMMALATCVVGVVAVDGLRYHPDYLCYLNYPRPLAHLQISDSNIDWGQSLPQIRAFLDRNAKPGQAVWLRYFGRGTRGVEHYLGGRVCLLAPTDPPPTSGLLIISPVLIPGNYSPDNRYAALGKITPDAVIGHSMRVYDLDRAGPGRPVLWVTK